ncbi:hypothetical protein SMD44_02544 [Streptomyces alboflavus]|uniref:Uncharacterized protein n=1 Tax=Streptomyces alboflavus TaxID=67267 RepID=A0A1Z1W9S8_9ACTN|nr:hypothetical protein SMD44_02544 [Streptomyces alboflavus]
MTSGFGLWGKLPGCASGEAGWNVTEGWFTTHMQQNTPIIAIWLFMDTVGCEGVLVYVGLAASLRTRY